MKTILVLLPVQQRHREKLERAGAGCRFVYVEPESGIALQAPLSAEQLAEADIIIGNPPAKLIGASPRLELLQLFSAGSDPYLVPGVLGENTRLCNATGAYGKAVSEHAFALTLAMMKKLMLYRDNQNRRQWLDHGMVASLCGATVLVVGLGDIGLSYARLVKAMGAHVIGLKRRQGPCPEGVDELYTQERMDELLPRADLVVSFLPGNSQTRHLYDRARFARMKADSFFVNCGRGGAVDSDALRWALTEGPLQAAAIDVTETEPLPEESPLWTLENLLITPHVAGWGHSPEILDRVVDIAAENLSAYLEGRPLRNLVDFETGYKR